jgi:tRNA (guanine37-N1)-methyltransferase
VWFGVITLFPQLFDSLRVGITGRALQEQRIELALWNPRDFTHDKHQTVDDHPYGGGPGMLMKVEPLTAAIQAAKQTAPDPITVIYVSPQGKPFSQAAAVNFLSKKSLLFIAGRYEGIDERIIKQEIDEEWSIGDYILTGGELPAMVMIDAITRLIPGALGDEDSALEDSLTSGLLKYPQYTRPEIFLDHAIPSILMSGHHRLIEEWRLQQSLGKTWLRRPDLLAKKTLNKKELALLMAFVKEYTTNSE